MELTWQMLKAFLKDELVSERTLPLNLSPPHPDLLLTDSRGDLKGRWFLPLVGTNFDGHKFIQEAFKKGALGAFCQQNCEPVFYEGHTELIWVKDTAQAYLKLAQSWRQLFSQIKLAAVTGSTGKTTTKSMVGDILSSQGNCLPYAGNFNNDIGIPLTLLKIRSHHQYGSLEIGARHKGDIEKLNPVVAPDAVALLNVGDAHLGEFGSKEVTYEAKLEIFSSAPKNATLICFGDDQKLVQAIASDQRRKLFFGFGPKNDFAIQEVRWKAPQLHLKIKAFGKIHGLTFAQGHEAYPINAAAAMALTYALGIPVEKALGSLENYRGVKGRYLVLQSKDFTLIDDTYNANPDSMKLGLITFVKTYPQEKKIIVLGDMLELGEKSNEAHLMLGAFCAKEIKPDLLVTVGSQGNLIALSAEEHGLKKERILSFQSVDELLLKKPDFKLFGHTIYAKASNGIGLTKFINSFDPKEA